MQIGDVVHILPPFDSLQGNYTVTDIVDGVVFTDGIDGGFDPVYLEVVQNGD